MLILKGKKTTYIIEEKTKDREQKRIQRWISSINLACAPNAKDENNWAKKFILYS